MQVRFGCWRMPRLLAQPLGIQQQFGDAIAGGFAKVYMQRTQIAATNPDTLMAKAALALFKPGSGLDNRENAH